MAEQREPSVEDILASIKRVLAEDAGRTPPRAAQTRPPAQSEPDILELTTPAVPPAEVPEEVLVDEGKADAMRASLEALATLSEPGASPRIVRSGETSLEELTRDLLRPMLKDWLDANLPPLVEAMVEREIRRISRKG